MNKVFMEPVNLCMILLLSMGWPILRKGAHGVVQTLGVQEELGDRGVGAVDGVYFVRGVEVARRSVRDVSQIIDGLGSDGEWVGRCRFVVSPREPHAGKTESAGW